MRQAIELAKKGKGRTNPNPLVGAIIVKDDKIIGQGYHEVFGQAHAEIIAIHSASQSVKDSTIYVSLEPCSHQGKTPSCAERLIKEEFARVVVAMEDPNPLVQGRGIQKLKDAGIKVDTNILADEAKSLNESFIKYIQQGLPFVAIKTAMTLDGKIATHTGHSKWISGEESRAMVHQLRHQYAAIMVGVDTVIQDDPLLTDRSDTDAPSHPIRIVVDTKGRVPTNAKVLDTTPAKTILACGAEISHEKIEEMHKKGVEIMNCGLKDGRVDLNQLMRQLGKRGIDSLLIEGGSTLNFSAFDAGIVDKVYSFIAPKIVGGAQAKTAVGGEGIAHMVQAIPLEIKSVNTIDKDVLIEALLIKV